MIFSEDTAFKNWLNRQREDLGLILPASFQDLENFEGASNLEVFRCLDKGAINYETNALHISTHMFYERSEVQQRLNMILRSRMGQTKSIQAMYYSQQKNTE